MGDSHYEAKAYLLFRHNVLCIVKEWPKIIISRFIIDNGSKIKLWYLLQKAWPFRFHTKILYEDKHLILIHALAFMEKYRLSIQPWRIVLFNHCLMLLKAY